jgi:RND family efflux transporter MFP subunit
MKPMPLRIAILALSTLAAAACQQDATASQTSDMPKEEKRLDERAQRVEILNVQPKKQTLTLTLPGEVEGSRDALLSSATGGYVEKVLVQKGELVKRGTELAWVNKSIADAQLAQAEAQLKLANHDLKVVNSAGGSISKSRKVQAEAQQTIAEAQHTMASLQAERARMRAPFRGVVAAADLETGEVAAPGQPLLRLVNVDTVKISLSISDRDIKWVKPGVSATVYLDGGSKAIKAEVTRVTPAADLETRTFIAEIDVPNPERTLMPGMMATTAIESTSAGQSLVIPQYALLTRREGNGVFIVEDNRAVWRPLVVEALMGHELIVASGLQAGDQVIMKGHRELNHGEPVLVVKNAGTESPAQAVESQQ